MKVRKPELEIPDDDPFAKDVLGRRESGAVLTSFVEALEGPFVLAIEGGYGSGKTTFLKMWQKELVFRKHVCFYQVQTMYLAPGESEHASRRQYGAIVVS